MVTCHTPPIGVDESGGPLIMSLHAGHSLVSPCGCLHLLIVLALRLGLSHAMWLITLAQAALHVEVVVDAPV